MTTTKTAPARRMSVSDLSKQVGLSPDTIRYYEKAGLLPPPERTAADYRSYDDSAPDRLRFIQGAQRLGLRLREIKTLLEVRDTGECPCEPAERLLRQRVAEIDVEMKRLRALRAELTAMASHLPGPECPDPTPGTWRQPTTSGRR
jgi:DNA-binding transcriptional MerR regulator